MTILVDMSSNMDEGTHMTQMKNFLKEFLSKLKFNPEEYSISITSFGGSLNYDQPFTTSIDEAKKAVDQMR